MEKIRVEVLGYYIYTLCTHEVTMKTISIVHDAIQTEIDREMKRKEDYVGRRALIMEPQVKKKTKR